MIAFDANVLFYSLDSTEAAKHTAALDLISQCLTDDEPPCLLWQVACETPAWLRRRQAEGLLTNDQIENSLQDVRAGMSFVVPTPHTLMIALALYKSHSLSHWDSLLLAACTTAGVDTLYSETCPAK
jgi:predicted nucleic acid-binding protein